MAGTDQATAAADRLAAMNLTGSVENHAFSDRVLIRSIAGRPDDWERARERFLELNDGACLGNLQVIMDAGVAVLSKLVATGTCVVVDGILKVPPEGTKQRIELRVEKVYPIPKTKLTLEFLRDHLHLRSRTNSIAAIAQIRNALAFATHSFFQELTTLISEAEILEKDLIKNPPPLEAVMEAAKQLVSERGLAVKQLKDAKASKADTGASVVEINKVKRAS
ncbi:hypothetical protein V6Z11_A08G285200 [Gossypium hirsutum]